MQRRHALAAAQTTSRRLASTTSAADLNADAVRRGDYPAFLIAPSYPPRLRDSYVALRAFNIELANVSESVSNPSLGTLRMKFWRDTLAAVFEGRPPEHPVALGLAKARSQARLSKYHFDRLIDAREANLRNPSFATLDALATYAHGTAYSLLALQLQLLQAHATEPIPPSELSNLDHSLSHVGLANTLTTLLMSAPHHAAKRVSIFPSDVAADCGLTDEALFRQGASAHGVRDAVAHLAAVAQGELATARKHLEGPLDADVAPVFLAAVPAQAYLDRLKRADYDVFAAPLQRRDWKLPWQIWLQSRRRRF